MPRMDECGMTGDGCGNVDADWADLTDKNLVLVGLSNIGFFW